MTSNSTNQVKWHALPADLVLNSLKATKEGLSGAEVQVRQHEFGLNTISYAKRKSSILRFLAHFHNILIYVLLASAAITAFLDHWLDAGVIFAVVLVNAIIGYVQEGQAEQAMEAVQKMLAQHTRVIRDGNNKQVKSDELVPGDIVLLEAGDKVPADIRLLHTYSLQLQEAVLTGESLAVEKHPLPVSDSASLGDRACMAYNGTIVAAGNGSGVVVATGAQTEIGKIGALLSTVETLTTPLVTQINTFAKWLTLFILIVSGALLVFGYFVEHIDFLQTFMAVVGLAVAAIPEGLPAVLTITLAMGMQEMAKRNAIIRKLPAIETLGAVSVICTDKTGTLTRNEMVVSSAVTFDQKITVDGVGYEPKGLVLDTTTNNATHSKSSTKKLSLIAFLCNDAVLAHENNKYTVHGDPMEGALLAFSSKVNPDNEKNFSEWKRMDTLPFDASRRFMATLIHHAKEDKTEILIKGAPEVIFNRCSFQTHSDNPVLDHAFWNQQVEILAKKGQRVLAFAYKPLTHNENTLLTRNLEDGFTLAGIVGISDPPREEVIDAIENVQRAGVRVKMLTGDHAETAKAIGKMVGLQNCEQVLTGSELDALSESDFKIAVKEVDIFARVSPEHKLKLVKALQSYDLTIAMTGDGVNDAPALKRADAGIAMGLNGTEAAKEASEIVLADDNFASIVAAVRQGRTVYDNLKKVITWTLPTNAAEALIVITALLFGFNMPITPIQILWINLITATTLGIALAFEKTEVGTMSRPPRTKNEPILDSSMTWQIILVSIIFMACVFGIYLYAIDSGYKLELARTLAVNMLVLLEVIYLFYVRNLYTTSFSWDALKATKAVWITVTIVLLAQVAFTFLPFMQGVFATQTVSFQDLLLLLLISIVIFITLEVEKQARLALKPKM